MSPLIPALAGATLVGGLLMLTVGLLKRPVPPPGPRGRARGRVRLSARTRWLLLIGLGVGILVAVLTGWLVAVILAPAALAGLPYILAAPPAQDKVARLEAMEEWVRSVSGVLTAGAGLEQALITSLRSTPAPIRPEVSRLVGRLRARWDTRTALRLLADELDDSTGDLIASQLLLGATRRGAGLTTVLDALAQSVAQDVQARREIEADRAKPRANARLITVISVGFLAVLALTGDYVAPYGTPLGQAVLLVLLSCFAMVLVWMRRMSKDLPLPRFVGAQVQEAAR